jgi:hypothetical protein
MEPVHLVVNTFDWDAIHFSLFSFFYQILPILVGLQPATALRKVISAASSRLSQFIVLKATNSLIITNKTKYMQLYVGYFVTILYFAWKKKSGSALKLKNIFRKFKFWKRISSYV